MLYYYIYICAVLKVDVGKGGLSTFSPGFARASVFFSRLRVHALSDVPLSFFRFFNSFNICIHVRVYIA